MLKNVMNQFIKTLIEEKQSLQQKDIKIELFKEEKDYVEKYELLTNELILRENSPTARFNDSYIERSHKETEEVIAVENVSFLNQPIRYLKEQKEEFIYLESRWLELIGVDAISIEADDVFGTYDVMVGLKLQKKFDQAIKTYLTNELVGKNNAFDLMFNQKDGVWDLNFTLDFMKEFTEDITLEQAYRMIYSFLFKLVETVEEESSK